MATTATPQQELTMALREYVISTFAERPLGAQRWVMNAEWLNECRRLDDSHGRAVFHPPAMAAPVCLLGIPIDVRDDGGVPHLEPA